jgi:hypothetical protein
MQNNTRLTQLYDQKFEKLKEQKSLADQMTAIANTLQESTNQSKKSLQAAIAVARQPGYFQYYSAPTEVESYEREKALNKLARQVQRVHRELEEINAEITSIEASMKQPAVISGGPTSLSQWFDVYGKPKVVEAQEDLFTSFQPSPKIYGGTSHHRAFKTQSSNMKKGRLTR